MKGFLVFAALVVAISAVSDQEAWAEFKETHGKSYKNLREEKLRFEIFKSNVEMINKHNERFARGEETYDMGINQFTDLTDLEFNELYLGFQTPDIEFTDTYVPSSNYTADSLDWRDKGAVTSVKNQLHCGSCWAFSALGALEGQNIIKNKDKTDLSEQELLDCSGSYGNVGCKGGLMTSSFNYIKANGIATNADYPYVAVQGICKKASKARASVKVTGLVNVAATESALQSAVTTIGPISVAIYADPIKQYNSGIFDSSCNGKLNHGVLAVGYGTEGGKDYWIVKNSWGQDWGDSGYFKIARGKNLCGIAKMTTYPVIA